MQLNTGRYILLLACAFRISWGGGGGGGYRPDYMFMGFAKTSSLVRQTNYSVATLSRCRAFGCNVRVLNLLLVGILMLILI